MESFSGPAKGRQGSGFSAVVVSELEKLATIVEFPPCIATISHSSSSMAQTAHFAGTLRLFDELSKFLANLMRYLKFLVRLMSWHNLDPVFIVSILPRTFRQAPTIPNFLKN